ncbi:MAG: HAD-IA family hydrolase [Nanoarchaeota archaeon]|nr:HAD-IA family hydrolase [Nanoarchaeota archaeon]
MIKTILCDLGNVIVFFDHKIIVKNLAKFSNKDENYIHQFFHNSKSRKDFYRGKITADKLFMNFKNNLNLKINFNQFKKIWCSCFTNLNKGMEKLLYKLKKHYKLILLSDTDEIHFFYIKEKYKVLDIFDDFVLSYKVGYSKPNPLIYLHALKKAKTLPNKILYIDDIHSHVTTAKFFGIKSVQYKNFEELIINFKKMNIKI